MKLVLGPVVITRGALDALNGDDVLSALVRHQRGFWGDVCEDDWRENDYSATRMLRILSSYKDRAGVKFWIITEADRSSSCVLLQMSIDVQ